MARQDNSAAGLSQMLSFLSQSSQGGNSPVAHISGGMQPVQMPNLQPINLPNNTVQTPSGGGGIIGDFFTRKLSKYLNEEDDAAYTGIMQELIANETNPTRKAQLIAASKMGVSSNPIIRKAGVGAFSDIIGGSQSGLNPTELQKELSDPNTREIKMKQHQRLGVPVGFDVDHNTGEIRPMEIGQGGTVQDYIANQQIRVKQQPGYGAEENLQNERKRLSMSQDANARAADATERTIANQGRAVKNDEFKNANTLRDEFNMQAKDYKSINNTYNNIKENFTGEPTAAKDISGIFQFIKMLDPASTVREGEFAAARNAAGVPDRVKKYLIQLENGQMLTTEQRKDFVDVAKGQMKVAKESHIGNMGRYAKMSKEYGINHENVIGKVDPKLFNSYQEYKSFYDQLTHSQKQSQQSHSTGRKILSPAEAKAAGMTLQQYNDQFK